MMKSELHLTNSESCIICLPIEFHGVRSRINSKGYHSLVPGLISILLETVWVPLIVAFLDNGDNGFIRSRSYRFFCFWLPNIDLDLYCYVKSNRKRNNVSNFLFFL